MHLSSRKEGTMDDAKLIELVRSSDPLTDAPRPRNPARAHALLTSIQGTARPSTNRRRLPSVHLAATAGILLVAIAVAAPAFGIDRLMRLLGGSPAPPAITEELGGHP